MTELRTHLEVLLDVFDPSGAVLVDVGAGDGGFSRQLVDRGATVVGIEVDERRVAELNASTRRGMWFLHGRAEDLPLPDASVDAALFMFSFHHVPLDVQDRAIREVRRVVRPAGRLHVVDPLPEGDMTDVIKPLEDETEVRRLSQSFLDRLPEEQFRLVRRDEYVIRRAFPDFETFLDKVVSNAPERAARLPAQREEVAQRFDRLASRTEQGYALDQPAVMYHYTLRRG